MEKMSEKERDMAIENYGLVGDFIRARHLEYDEWHGVISCALCQAAMHYEEKSAASFRTFALKCMENAFIDALRKEKKADVVPFSAYENEEMPGYNTLEAAFPESFSVAEEETYEPVLIDDASDAIRRVIEDALPATVSAVFLKYAAGESIREIAAQCGISKDSCCRKIRKAREILSENAALVR